MTKLDLKRRAIELRRQGYSYNLIRKQVPVSKSSLSLWLSDVPYKPNKDVVNRIRGAQLKSGEWKRRDKQRSLELANNEAKEMLGDLSDRDLFMLGIGVYIGEGAKTAYQTRIINSDPQVICLAIRWLEEFFGLSTANLYIRLYLYPDNDIKKSLLFWSNITGIPISQFSKTQVDRRVKKEKKKGMLKHGTAHLGVKSCGEKRFGVLLFRKILALIDNTYRQIN